MHILLTDVLTCPRCGPEFGLILLADEIDERRVTEGRLGCANCRDSYPIHAGVVDLVPAGGAPLGFQESSGMPEGEGDQTEAAYRLGALLGMGDASATVLLAGVAGGVASRVSGLLPATLVAATAPERVESEPAGPSWLRLGHRLPFRSRSLGGIALYGPAAATLLEESVRALAPAARLVLHAAPADAAGRLREMGMDVLLEEGFVTVACLSRPR